MSWKTVYITQYLWNRIPRETRKQMLGHAAKSAYVSHYASNVADVFYARNELAAVRLLQAAIEQAQMD